jgi:hypothetical protein
MVNAKLCVFRAALLDRLRRFLGEGKKILWKGEGG